MAVLLWPSLGLLFSFVYFTDDVLGCDVPVEIGEPVILPCINQVEQTNCSKVTWLSNDSPAVELVILGKRKPDRPDRITRVSLLTNCSLKIIVRPEDDGCFTCRQFSAEGGKQIAEDGKICLCVKKGSATTENYDATSVDNDSKQLLLIIIPSLLVVGAFVVMALIAWLRNHKRAQIGTSTENQDTLQPETKTTAHEMKNGEDVLTYIELNHNVLKPREVDIDKENKKTEYATINLS